ncbi:hypothetical protein AC623_16280 [Bacillus sp. FJAT-27231]|uniref:DUF262 domain-containing protein n=1 Tax=Bacillus sp. FJAT-27231 TaxID=1679168 RepID=UPI000670BE5C|nr:DUF262 domain-containing protein [Bacillus sp. FJAT-27231]KMY55298.1 hypothetical protein AC623_16280 [Bacillus sp. FJAT-27231]
MATIDKKIEAKEILFKDLFGSKFAFKIPGYQRQYSWEKDQLEQLFEDIKEAMELKEDSYFLGSVILQVIDQKSDNSGMYDVVDGQQRLTTLTILLAVMRDLITNPKAKTTLQSKIYQEADPYEDKPETVRLRVRDRDYSFFKKYILEEGGTKLTVNEPDLTESQDRMTKAIYIFSEKFLENGQLDEQLVDNMIHFILNKCMFVYVKTGTFTSAFRLFSILNDRGMPLSNADLLKSTNLGAITETERLHYQNLWEAMEEELGREELEKLLGYIRLIFVKEKARKTIQEEYEEKIFAKNPDFRGKQFIEYVKQFADIYREKVLNADIQTTDKEVAVKYHGLLTLMRDFIPSSDWIPVLIHFIQKFQSPNEIYSFLRVLERKFVVSWIKGITPTGRVTEVVKMIQAVDNASDPNDVAKEKIFQTSEDYKAVKLNIQVDDLYKKKYAKYLLLRLDMSLNENANVKKSYTGVISVEHILPQNPSEGSSWRQDFTKEERKVWTNRLGNLVLLSRKKNSSANNREFHIKLQKYFSNGITDFELTKDLKKFQQWTVKECESRHENLTDKLMAIYFVPDKVTIK